MKIEFEKPKTFDIICLVLFVLFFSFAIYFLFSSNYVLAVIVLLLSIWALSIAFGSVVLGTAYLEGHTVRLLTRNGGKMPIDEIQKYYANYGSMDLVVDKLEKRNVVVKKDYIIELKEENLAKGYKNRLMLWGTRRVKL
jgi:hypothetical protein